MRSGTKLKDIRATAYQSTYKELPPTPRNLKEALDPNNPDCIHWLKATNDEFKEMFERNVFEELSEEEANYLESIGITGFDSKVVLKVKREANNTIKYKARLVARGFTQVFGIDYDETYSPTVSPATFMTVLFIAKTFSWEITGVDIGNAYLEALANRLLIMTMPVDWTHDKKIKVRLLKNIYGTKQAALLWFVRLTHSLEKFGFRKFQTDACCFMFRKKRKDYDCRSIC